MRTALLDKRRRFPSAALPVVPALGSDRENCLKRGCLRLLLFPLVREFAEEPRHDSCVKFILGETNPYLGATSFALSEESGEALDEREGGAGGQ